MTHYLENPIKLQFELSSMCNALCLGCVRTDTTSFNNKKYNIPEKQYISFETFKKLLLAPEFATVKELEFCGTIDDPLMHPEFLEFLDWSATLNKQFNVLIHTNASLRNVNYWQNLASILKKHHRHMVKFSIDGLEDTNSIYRQNTSWKKIMENADAFIKNGGHAGWQFLIFPWNEHQVLEAKEISIKMGFKEFMSRHDRSIVREVGLENIQKIKKTPEIKKHNYTPLISINKKLENVVHNEISCNNKNKRMYFISFDSRLWPCCFLHNGFMNSDKGYVELLTDRLFNAYNSDNWNSLEMYSVGDILNHNFYKKDLVQSWSNYTHGPADNDRIHRCTQVCNVKQLEVLPIGQYKIL